MISQPRYLPAINYLHRIKHSDLFIILNDVQRQGRGFENRNKILVKGDEFWLTIPIESSSREIISRTRVSNKKWIETHKTIIQSEYKKSNFFNLEILDSIYEMRNQNSFLFQDIIMQILKNIFLLLEINTSLVYSSDLIRATDVRGSDKLVELCKRVNAEQYISGPNGLNYGIVEAFKDSGVNVLIHKNVTPTYKHLEKQDFIPFLSIIDVLFNIGLESTRNFLKEKILLNSEVNYGSATRQ